MDLKNNKPLIIIAAALSIAVITISIQVVFLTFTVKDQKDSIRYISNNTDVHAIQNKLTGVQTNMIDLSRQVESLRNDLSRLSAEFGSTKTVINKVGNDSHFLQQELSNYDDRIMDLEVRSKNLEITLKSLERAVHYNYKDN